MSEGNIGDGTRLTRYTVRDLVIMAALSAISAVGYAGLGHVWAVATAALGPLGGAFIGLFQFGHLIAGCLIRKPGTVFIVSVLSTAVQALLGDPAGIYVIGWGVTHGIGTEAVFLLMRGYRGPPRLAVLMLAGGLGAVCGHFFSYALYGWEGAISMFFVSIPILLVSSAVMSGMLAYYVFLSLEKAGLGEKK